MVYFDDKISGEKPCDTVSVSRNIVDGRPTASAYSQLLGNILHHPLRLAPSPSSETALELPGPSLAVINQNFWLSGPLEHILISCQR